LVVERHANLRITHKEEISDSCEPPAEESSKYTAMQATPVPQRNLVSSLRRYSLPLLGASIAILVAALGLLSAASRPDATAIAPIRSLAVLPFKNLDPQGEDAHLGIGLADALITRLSSIKDLNVRPTSAVLKFNNNDQDASDAALKLRVDAVLEGSIYRAGDRVRVTARLVRTSDQSLVWAGQFDEKAGDFFSIQNAISQRVSDSLALSLGRSEKDALAKRHTESADAYQLYVEGRYNWNKRDFAGMMQAEACFRKAIDRDPNFALAYLGLADTLSMRSENNESLHAIQKAIELDENLGEAYASRGFWSMFKAWRWDQAEADFKRAIELRPGYGTAHQWYATLLAITGRVEEAKTEMRRALEIDPMSHNFLADMGQMHYFAKEYDEAESYCLKALGINPDFVFAHHNLRDIYLAKREDDKSFEHMLKADKALHPSSSQVKTEEEMARNQAGVRELYRQSGLKGIWRDSIKTASARVDALYYLPLFYYHTMLGEKEEALAALEKAYEGREFMLPFVNIDPIYDGIRSEPRFLVVMQKMKLAR
ncbi:MAG TPA: FlgO family outer membrane protein, partial [Blastocatellia bacterium]|nr:FlgO family outer membrane protein [Blastocatellia bacterium]